MDFGSMNIQLVVPKVPEVSQIHHTLTQQGAVNQAFETLRQKEDAQLKEKQVRAREKMEDGRIKDADDDSKKHGGYKKNSHGGEKEESEEPSEERMAVDTFRGHHIDIQL